jgi:hypothetical protein
MPAKKSPYAIECGGRLKTTRLIIAEKEDKPEFKKIRGFSDYMGVHEDTYGSWEKGLNLVPPDFVKRLRDDYGFDHNWIYYGDSTGLPERLTRLMRRAS